MQNVNIFTAPANGLRRGIERSQLRKNKQKKKLSLTNNILIYSNGLSEKWPSTVVLNLGSIKPEGLGGTTEVKTHLSCRFVMTIPA